MVYRHKPAWRCSDLKVLQHELMAFQVFYAAGCGAVGWLCWSDGNPVNNMYVALMMVCVIWAGAFTRAAHRRIFIVGTVDDGTRLLVAVRDRSGKRPRLP